MSSLGLKVKVNGSMIHLSWYFCIIFKKMGWRVLTTIMIQNFAN